MILLYVFIFLASFALLFWAGKFLVDSLNRVARFLEWREFVVAFFAMAFASSLPNLFLGISSALHKIPQLSFGDVVGGNIVDLTIIAAFAALIAKGLPTESRMVQTSSIFTICISILPLLLILDGVLGRIDGIFLILAFTFYAFWLFSKEERFKKVYGGDKVSLTKGFKVFIKNLGKVILGIIFLLLATQGIVKSTQFIVENFNLSFVLFGLLITGLGNALPEIYFAVVSAKRGETWMILGDLMGAVIVPATLVLGVVALICPIRITDFSSLVIARLFLIISALFFFFCIRTGRKITKREAIFLLGVYVMFVLVEILMK